METREKALAGVLAAVLGGWFVVPPVWNAVNAPVTEREASAKSLKKAADDRGEEELQTFAAIAKLDGAAARALSPDVRSAQRTYQSWLTDLADRCGFEGTEVTPQKTTPIGKTGSAVEVKLEGRATASELARFLSLLSESGVLQTVVQTNLAAASSSPADELEVTVRTEAVSLEGGGRRPLPYSEWTVGEATEDGVAVTPAEGPFEEFEVAAAVDGEDRVYAVGKSSADGRWTFKGDAPPAGTTVRGRPYPIPEDEPRAAEAWTLLAEQGPFAIPVFKPPIRPRVIVDDRLRVYRGDRLDVPVEIVGLPPGEVSLKLEGGPEGMRVDADTRRLTFETTAQTPLGPAEAKLVASNAGVVADAAFAIEVREPNEPPVIADVDVPPAYPGREWRLSIEATDPEGQDLRLNADGPDGVRVDGMTLVWTAPKELEGESARVALTVIDDGAEPKEARRTIEVPVEFDAEGSTELIGSVRIDGERAALLIDRRSGERTVLKEGQEVAIGRLSGTVTGITEKTLTIAEDGGESTLRLGQTVADRAPRGGA